MTWVVRWLSGSVERGSRSAAVVILAFVVQMASFGLLRLIGAGFEGVTGGLEPFDFQNDLTQTGILEQLPSYTEASRTLYRWFAAVDLVFPLVAAVFQGMLIAVLLRANPVPAARTLLRLGLPALPLATTLFDWLENGALLAVVETNAGAAGTAALAAVAFKRLKLAFLVLGAVTTVVVIAWWAAARAARARGGAARGS